MSDNENKSKSVIKDDVGKCDVLVYQLFNLRIRIF